MSGIPAPAIRAVVFDLDGVLLDSEGLWDRARRAVATEHGSSWPEPATAAMQGMSSPEWSRYMRDQIGLDVDRAIVVDEVVASLLGWYERDLPLLPGAVEVVHRLGERWPLGLASSSNRVVIDRVLELAGLSTAFAATVSSEEVPAGKPHPDVYVEVVRRLGHPPESCVAIEDSGSGMRSALAAGLRVVALPNREWPPPPAVLAEADIVIEGLADLTPERVDELGSRRRGPVERRLDEEEDESFPASDSHSDWAGPPS